MKKSLWVTALALVLALGTLIGLTVRLDRTAVPVGMEAAQSWGDSAAAAGLTVHTGDDYGGKLFWSTDYRVADGQETTRFSFRAQESAVRSTGVISDVRDEWYLTRLCVTEHGKFVTENLLQERMPQTDDRTVHVRDDFVAYRMYLTPVGGGGGDGTVDTFWQESQSDWVPFDKLRIPIGDGDLLTERVYSLDIQAYSFEYILQAQTRFRPFSVGGDGHVLVTVGFAPDAPAEPSWAPEGFGLWDVSVKDVRVDFDGGWYNTRRPDVDGARLVLPLDIENQRVAAMTEDAEGNILLVTAEDGQYVLRLLDGGTYALRQQLVLGAAEQITRAEKYGEPAEFEAVTIRPEDGFTLITLGGRELLVLVPSDQGCEIRLRSQIMELRDDRDSQGKRIWTWCATGDPDENGNDYAGGYYSPTADSGFSGDMVVIYRDGKLALANRPAYEESTVFLEVYGNGGMLYSALLENRLAHQAFSSRYALAPSRTGDPLSLRWD